MPRAVGVRAAASALLAVAALGLLLAPSATGAVVSTTGDEAAQRLLAERYAPYVVVRERILECVDGEPYLPVRVDTVLGRDDVVLRGPDGAVVTAAPRSTDLAGKGDGYYLDLPGDPLTDSCAYEQWFRGTSGADRPAVYAHVATDQAHPGSLALQYWFFWVFNDWNDKHEGDWEMVQLVFEADDAAAAMRGTPTTVAFAQHEGAEVVPWDDSRLVREGDHLVVYPSQGSHASYTTQSTWFGKSAVAGFGCDDSTSPGTLLRPEVVLLPGRATAADRSTLGWLQFEGRWGERAPSFNNGPTGPNLKQQWTAPITWQEAKGRPDAVAVPPLAGSAVDMFCSVTAAGSALFIDFLAAPWLVTGLLVALLLVLLLLVRATSWRPAVTDPVDRQRRAGQILTSAFALCRRDLRVYAALGGLLLVAIAVPSWLQTLVLSPQPGGDVANVSGDPGGWGLLSALLLALVSAVAALLVAAAVLAAAADAAAGRRVAAAPALRAAVRRRSTAWTLLVLGLVVGPLVGSVLLAPLGLWLLARWAVSPAAAAVEGSGSRAARRRSRDLTGGRRWRTLILALTLWFVGAVLPALVGAAVLLVLPVDFLVANLVAGLVLALLAPVALVGLALHFLDLRARAAEPVWQGPRTTEVV